MKVTELQIGDWVRINDVDYPNPARFDGIQKKGGEYYVYFPQWDMLVSIEKIEPIAITPKILEANGFTRSKAFVEWKYEDDDIYMLWKPFPWIKIQLEDHTVMFPCEFVHELQHALHLCGIDKNIVIEKE